MRTTAAVATLKQPIERRLGLLLMSAIFLTVYHAAVRWLTSL